MWKGKQIDHWVRNYLRNIRGRFIYNKSTTFLNVHNYIILTKIAYIWKKYKKKERKKKKGIFVKKRKKKKGIFVVGLYAKYSAFLNDTSIWKNTTSLEINKWTKLNNIGQFFYPKIFKENHIMPKHIWIFGIFVFSWLFMDGNKKNFIPKKYANKSSTA